MPLRTKTFLTDSAPGHEPIQVFSNVKRVRIREKPPAGTIPPVGGTSGYQIFGVKLDGTPDTVPTTGYAGEPMVIEKAPYPHVDPIIGHTLAFISALAGTMTMEQTEEF